MEQPDDMTLYLSKDKQYLTDINGVIISYRMEEGGFIFYATISIESEAYKKKCMAFKAKRVCTSWNANNACLIWDEVDVCTQWQYYPDGFNNIS